MNFISTTRALCILTLSMVLMSPAVDAFAQAGPSRPNIVLIVADDLGYNDLGCFGAENIRTPNIDNLATNGIRFTDFYVSQAVCSASRASIMTGCYANRVGILGALIPEAKIGISKEETTIAEMLVKRGYRTGMIGKWHLGDRKEFLPTRHGFDSYFGIPYSNDMWPEHPAKLHFPPLPVYEDTRVWATLEDQSEVTTWYTERAVEFIRKSRSKPFFLYMAYSMPHVPLYVSDKFKGKSKQGLYGDVVMEIDWSVGEIMRGLEEEGLDSNTLVIFTSDNGPWLSYGAHAGSAYPLREGKGTAWDGGQRVPCDMSGPGSTPKGESCREPVMTIDLLPTIAAITGASLPEREIDGRSILPLMTGEEEATSPHGYLFFYYNRKLNCVRSGRWKLHLPHGYQTLGGRKGGDDGMPVPYDQAFTNWALYDMENDPDESKNVAENYPKIFYRLRMAADSMVRLLGDAGVTGSACRLPGYLSGYEVEKGEVKNMAKGASVNVEAPATKYTEGGDSALVDGITGSMRFNDGAWLGSRGEDLKAEICFDSDTLVRKVVVRFLVDERSWIFEPESVYLRVPGKKGGKETIAMKRQKPAGKGPYQVVSYAARVSGKARCIHLTGVNRGVCPPGHPGEGKRAWIFADEIVLR